MWHEITSLTAYRKELNRAAVRDFLHAVHIYVSLTSELGRKLLSRFLSENTTLAEIL